MFKIQDPFAKKYSELVFRIRLGRVDITTEVESLENFILFSDLRLSFEKRKMGVLLELFIIDEPIEFVYRDFTFRKGSIVYVSQFV